MKKNLSNIVNLVKYPIHDLQSPKIKKIIKKCKTELDSDSCSVIPNFILPNSLNVMKKELEQQLNEVYMSKESINAYLYAKDDPTLPKDHPKKIDDVEKISDALNCQVIEVFRGIDDFLAIVKDESIVETIDPNIEKIAELDSRGLIVSAKGETTDFTSRVFGPNVGVDEDPVTGSAHALLATYWGDVLNLQKMKARQASKRGGELICEVLENNVEITGKAKLYLQGEIYF